ncbi:MAG: anti-sigma-I factor RsgI family protein [Christensenellales bacterium]|jgi:hypothetical protein
MRYMILECRRGYAVALDERGRFLRVANLQYEVGQVVENVVMEKEIPGRAYGRPRHLLRVLTAAACLCILALGSWQYVFASYGNVRMEINPDVEITVNRLRYAIGLEGLNGEGEALISGVSTFMKTVDDVAEALSDRAVEMGYLDEGGRIRVTAESENEKWRIATEERVALRLGTRFEVNADAEGTDQPQEIIIPVTAPDATEDTDDDGDDDLFDGDDDGDDDDDDNDDDDDDDNDDDD